MVRLIAVVLSIALVVLAWIIGAGGVLLWWKLEGGRVVDLGTLGDWWFLLRAEGLVVSHENRILFVVNPLYLAGALAIVGGFYLVFANERNRRMRRRGFTTLQ